MGCGGTAPYERVAATIVDVYERLAPQPGRTWLDLACGTGAVAERAAASGARGTGIDLAHALIETARRRATELGLEIDYRVGDCERLDLSDASFEAVSSSCGILFAPDRAATARELATGDAPRRSARPGELDPDGRCRSDVRDDGAVPARAAAERPVCVGRRDAVRDLLGESFELDVEALVSTLSLPSAEAYWQLFSTSYGPTRTLAESLGERREELHRAWVDFFDSHYRANGEIAHAREYLLVVGERR